MPTLTSAASRCSTVSTVAPLRPKHRGVVHGRDMLHGGGNLDAQVGPAKNNAGISRRPA